MKIPKTSFSWAMILMIAALGSMSCREHGYRLQKTPAVQKVLNDRKSRVLVFQVLKAKGLIGENNEGFITILKPTQPKEKSLVEAENRDRKFIYDTVVAQNHLGPEGLAKVEEEFAKTRRDRAKKGNLIQLPSGKWVRK